MLLLLMKILIVFHAIILFQIANIVLQILNVIDVEITLYWIRTINAFHALLPLKIVDFVLHNKNVKFVRIILYLKEEIKIDVRLVQ